MNSKTTLVGIVEKDNTYAIIERAQKEGNLSRTFPSGKLEATDVNEQAGIEREVLDETGVTCKAKQHMGERYVANNTIRLSYWLCYYVDGTINNDNSSEVKNAQWATKQEIFGLFTTDIFPPVKEYLENK